MIGFILAGGFAKRLWPLTKETPKPLLEVAGKPIIEHIIAKLENLGVDKIYISTNSKYGSTFEKWASGKNIKIIVEPPMTEEQKFGAIGGLRYFLDKEDIRDEFIMINGDNLFEDNLQEIFSFYRQKQAPVFGLYDVKDIEEARKLGIAEIDESGKVIGFMEKSPEPKTTLASTGIYFFPANIRERVNEYLSEKNNPDAPGFFINWLRKKTNVFGYLLSGKWFDIGSIETYELAKKEYKSN